MAWKKTWTAYVKDEDRKKEIEQSFRAAVVMRKRLIEILKRKQEGSFKNSFLEEGYESSNWALKQADSRGYERALHEIMSLLQD
jgi:hypothetical protein